MWTREALESLREMDRPKVRCAIDRVDIRPDGSKTEPRRHTFDSRISVDGNNPWLVGWVAAEQKAFRVSWGLVCEVLNDRFAAPVYFPGVVEYEIN